MPKRTITSARWASSFKKPVTVSSTAPDSYPENAVDENIRTWWSAASANEGEWLCVDLGKSSDVRAIQVNLADEGVMVDFPADSYGDARKTRHIELYIQQPGYSRTHSYSNPGT